MGGILGVTGTPGTGKKSIAPLVAKNLGLGCVSLNDFASSHGLIEGSGSEWEVDTQEMRRRLSRVLSGPAVVYGHLLTHTLGPTSVAKVVVLRCEPAVLKERLIARHYPLQKVVDNVEAELIGLVSSESFDTFGRSKTFEVDTTRSSVGKAAETVAQLMLGRVRPPSRVDWTADYDSGEKLRSLLSVEEG